MGGAPGLFSYTFLALRTAKESAQGSGLGEDHLVERMAVQLSDSTGRLDVAARLGTLIYPEQVIQYHVHKCICQNFTIFGQVR